MKETVIGDLHYPYTDIESLTLALEYAYNEGVDCIIINGDSLDFSTISRFISKPNEMRVMEQIEGVKNLLAWMQKVMDVKIVFHAGNHDKRIEDYVLRQAPELYSANKLEKLLMLEDMKIRHMGYDFSELQKTITAIVEKLPLTVDSMNKFKQVQLTENQIMEFAQKALETRFGELEMKRITVNYTEFIKPTRKEDEGNGLWEVFNRIQEKVIDGDFEYGYANKSRKARRIKNFQQDVKLNSELWELALNYC